jgi:hypothetical protein
MLFYYRDKKVVGVFVLGFRAPLQQHKAQHGEQEKLETR